MLRYGFGAYAHVQNTHKPVNDLFLPHVSDPSGGSVVVSSEKKI